MTNKRLDPEFEEQLYDYLNNNHPDVAKFEYEITDENIIIFSGFINNEYNSEKALDCIQHLEKMMDAHFVGITNIKSHFTFSYKFNQK